jgi:hypothetical protein
VQVAPAYSGRGYLEHCIGWSFYFGFGWLMTETL